MLSRSRGRQSIRLLRDFDESNFYKPLDGALRVEDERLEELNTKVILENVSTHLTNIDH